jgi:hypothetical protein
MPISVSHNQLNRTTASLSCGETYCILAVPTGARGLVCIGHAITKVLASRACAGTTSTPRAYLDNIKIAGSAVTVDLAVKKCFDLAACINASLSVQSAYSHHYNWLGAECTHTKTMVDWLQQNP